MDTRIIDVFQVFARYTVSTTSLASKDALLRRFGFIVSEEEASAFYPLKSLIIIQITAQQEAGLKWQHRDNYAKWMIVMDLKAMRTRWGRIFGFCASP
ncbi:hypothetical protein RB195_010020 [Necator americanus]|uniref:Uncharacterized protein n=1 Tax=Necator americanus TaxID=51031 RepID=A0ABR1CW10_NECAM